jgi:heme-degrading monooxygenase HmoA
VIAKIIEHWVHEDKIEQAKELFRANTEAMRKLPGLVCRYTLQSSSDPSKWTTIAIWENEEFAKAWATSPDHIWDVYGKKPVVPSGTAYHRKYGQATSVQAKPVVGETHVVLPDE